MHTTIYYDIDIAKTNIAIIIHKRYIVLPSLSGWKIPAAIPRAKTRRLERDIALKVQILLATISHNGRRQYAPIAKAQFSTEAAVIECFVTRCVFSFFAE